MGTCSYMDSQQASMISSETVDSSTQTNQSVTHSETQTVQSTDEKQDATLYTDYFSMTHPNDWNILHT